MAARISSSAQICRQVRSQYGFVFSHRPSLTISPTRLYSNIFKTNLSRQKTQLVNVTVTRNMSVVTRTPLKAKKLYTPGPLGVTMSVKEAMLRDVGSRDTEFIACIKFIRQKILEIAEYGNTYAGVQGNERADYLADTVDRSNVINAICCTYRTEEHAKGHDSVSLSRLMDMEVQPGAARNGDFTKGTRRFINQHRTGIIRVTNKKFSCIPMQGSGTFAVDASFQTVLPKEGARALVIENGAYGKRMVKICEAAGIACDVQSFREDRQVEPEVIDDALSGRTHYDLVAVVHSETSSGVINPVTEVGNIVKSRSPDSIFLVDAISSFGAVPLDLEASKIDVFISSANKCLQGVPGFAFVVARNELIDKCKGNSRTLSLDLYDQVKQLDKTSQFRFTPPTHSMLAFKQSLVEFEAEGGFAGRSKRYQENRAVLRQGMRELGFKELLDENIAGYIISSYLYPKDPKFDFMDFYNRLNEKDLVIYPGKVLDIDCFRIGTIGDLHPEDMRILLKAIREVLADMNISVPVKN